MLSHVNFEIGYFKYTPQTLLPPSPPDTRSITLTRTHCSQDGHQNVLHFYSENLTFSHCSKTHLTHSPSRQPRQPSEYVLSPLRWEWLHPHHHFLQTSHFLPLLLLWMRAWYCGCCPRGESWPDWPGWSWVRSTAVYDFLRLFVKGHKCIRFRQIQSIDLSE